MQIYSNMIPLPIHDVDVITFKICAKKLHSAADCYGLTDLKIEVQTWFVYFTAITSHNLVDRLLDADAKNCNLLQDKMLNFFVEEKVKDQKDCWSFDSKHQLVSTCVLLVSFVLCCQVLKIVSSATAEYSTLDTCSLTRPSLELHL